MNARVHFQAELGGNRGTGVEQFVCLAMPVTTDVTGRWLIKGVPEWLLDGLHGTATMADGGLMTTRSVAGDPRVRAELREGTFRFVMESGGGVAGQVVDPSATPIAGAAVSILAAPNFRGPSTVTAADGTFRFENRVSGTNLVTVQADGWAPRTVVAVVAPRPVPIRVVLAPGLPIRWRVTDSGGAPLEGVSVRLDSVPPDLGRRATDASITRAEFATRTDADGRAAWNHAPDEDLTFVFGEFGEWGVQRRVLRPSEEDHVIRLSRALVTSGTVVDANEGSPVRRFRVSRMSRLRDPSTGEWVPAADPHTPAREFVEGKFRQAWTHDDPSGTLGNEGFFLLVEADGYEPVISRWISSQEGHARLDLSLRTIGTSKTWLVRAPDGTPAGHAEVVTVDLRQVPALLAPDGIGGMLRDRMVRTEGDGTVLMSVDTSSVSEKVFLAYHREGMALASVSEVARSGVVELRAWSRIEGRLRNRTVARPGATLELEGASDGPDRLQPLLERFATVTDSEGRFECPRVPPGRLRLSIRDKARPTSMSDGDSLDVPIETEPGKTVSLEIGADHRPIRLRLAEPAILVLMASVSEGAGSAAERSSELRGEGHGLRITLGQTGGGVWSTPSAPPGRYRLAVLPGEVMTPTTARELKLVGEITVPPSPTGEVFDAGELGIPAAGEE
ncbi:MAG: carboxypeptidase regulatory-like domain-containing protein [Verrucomicrobiales bacterium]|nr:carboxypeptidase regulatory-like domain-containing protein [Verrucomicrobiales bacterium]